jgi:hypothetical protein
MKTRLHKFFSAALALCLVLTLNVTLCAADEGSGTTAETSDDDVIKVIVPTTGSITANPNMLDVKMDDGTISNAQIVHQAQALVNNGDTPVSVDVKVTGQIQDGSGAMFTSSTPSLSSKLQRIFLFVEFGTDQNWSTSYDETSDNQLLVTKYSTSASNVMTIDAGGTGYFHFAGMLTAGSYPMWSNDTDTFTVTLTFTFTALDTGTKDENQDEPQAVSDEDLDDESMIQPGDEPLDDTGIISGSEGNDNVTATTPADNTQPAAPTDSGEDDQTDPSNDATQPTETDESGQDDPAQSGETGETGQDGQNDQSSNTGDNQVQSQGTGEIIEVNPDDTANTTEDSTPET